MKLQYRIETESKSTRYGYELYRKTETEAIACARTMLGLGDLKVTVIQEKIDKNGFITRKQVNL